jgi:hypothetical protein
MPLKRGKKNIKSNFHEFRHGKTFKRTTNKFGKEHAVKQMQAVVLGEARKSGHKHQLGVAAKRLPNHKRSIHGKSHRSKYR